MSFQVIPADVPASIEDWRRAMSAPVSELPSLDEKQQAEVQRLSLNEDQFKRLRVLLSRYATERQAAQGHAFGAILETMLEPLGYAYSLASISRKGTPMGWRVTIRHESKGVFEFQCLFPTVEALTNGRVSQDDWHSLREQIFFELGEQDYLKAQN